MVCFQDLLSENKDVSLGCSDYPSAFVTREDSEQQEEEDYVWGDYRKGRVVVANTNSSVWKDENSP